VEPFGFSSNKAEYYDKGDPRRLSQRNTMFMFKDARKAIELYKFAFGAQERFAMPGPAGKEIMHAELRIGNSIIMMEEKCQRHPGKSAENHRQLPGQPLPLCRECGRGFPNRP